MLSFTVWDLPAGFGAGPGAARGGALRETGVQPEYKVGVANQSAHARATRADARPEEQRCPALDLGPARPRAGNGEARAAGRARAAVSALARWYLPAGEPRIPADPASVVVVTGGNLGGAIISIPLVRAVRERFPRSHLAVVSNTRSGRELMELAGTGDSFHTIPEGALRTREGLRGYAATLRRLRGTRPELMIANFDSQVDHLLAPLRIPVRVGHAGRRATGGELLWQHLLNVPVPVHTGMNWLDSYRMLAERVGARFPGHPALEVAPGLRERAGEMLRGHGLADGERALAVQVGVWPHQEWKQWPPRRLAEACAALWRTRGLRPVLLGSDTGERTRRELRAAAPEVPFIDLVGSTTIAEAAAVLDRCAVSICNDSGLMHLSAAVGTPTVALYGMTDPEITWCHGPEHRVVRRQDCRPCYSVAPRVLAACPHKMCLAALPVAAVVAAAAELADGGSGRPLVTLQHSGSRPAAPHASF